MKIKTDIKVITVDFWNTLFRSDFGQIRNSARLKVLLNTLSDLGINLEHQTVDAAIKSSWEYYNDKWMNELRTPTTTEIMRYIWTNMQIEENEKALAYLINFFETSILYFPPSFEKNALDSIKKLSEKYKLAIVSDTGFSPGKIMTQMMDELGVSKYFSAFSYSDETGVAKPHPLAFETALKKLECKPDNSIHIGDIERTDIEGAKSLGMYAIRYDGDPDFILTESKSPDSKADFIATDWNEIVDFLM